MVDFMIQKLLHITTLLFLSISLNGCGLIYRADIVQGNYVEQPQIDMLKLGMTPEQVIYIMGTPMVTNPFDQNTLIYLSHRQNKNRHVTQETLRLTFKAGKLAKIEQTNRTP